ncbi:type 4a pilus biogenesis protein PilO [Paludisphaera borealis]|uniref:General secretion pathway protein M n=1 Tax=Paludisphaera borealis TaxID=1387353 RepID=A0A1U7CYV6_9BACT|nr:type 4a pilus biogenesis protein PilO [Paludisphaera borealis]APW64142.1 hypothetical protein BSF38_05734 [Paludisphaera borealis]
MATKRSASTLEHLVLAQVRDPLRLRFVLAAGILAAWHLSFYGPIHDQVATTLHLAARERTRAATAARIEILRETLDPFKKRIPEHSDPNELIHYVMAHCRQSPVKILDLKPSKTLELGPFNGIGLRISLETTFIDLYQFLAWVENDRRLLRVESLKILPKDGSNVLHVEIELLSLVEKEKPKTAKPAAGAGPRA